MKRLDGEVAGKPLARWGKTFLLAWLLLCSILPLGAAHAQAPAVTLSQTSLSWPYPYPAAWIIFIPTQNVTITNSGATSLTISDLSITGPNAGQFSVTAGSTPVTLAPGDTHSVSVTFSPPNSGLFQATLSITSNAPSSPDTVALRGEGGADLAGTSTPWYFPATVLGGSSSQSQLLENRFGNVPLTINSITLTGEDAGSFGILAGGGSGSLAPGDGANAYGMNPVPGSTRTITVAFRPTRTGTHHASLNFDTNADLGPGGSSVVELFGIGILPAQATVSPGALDFGNQFLGTSNASQNVTFTSTGTGPVTISSISLGGANPGAFSIVSGGGGGTLNPGASRSISIVFAPTTVGAQTAVLSIASDGQGSPHSVSLSGNGIKPSAAVLLNPSGLSFGSQLLGTTSPPQTVTVTNNGTASLTIISIALSGANPGSFVITSGGSAGTLPPGSSRIIGVAFSPAVVGPLSASLVITDDASGSPHQISLLGTGVPPAPAVSLSPASLDFGYQAVGATSAPRSVRLINSGTAPLSIGSVSLGGANPGSFAITGGGSGGTLASGASQTMSLTFTPTTTGNFSASLSIVSDALGSPHSVSLTGAGGAPAINISPTSLDFGALDLGRIATQSLTVTNTGTAPLSISRIDRSGDPDFSVAGGGMTLGPGESRSLTVSFSPVVVGARQGSLSVIHNAGGSPATVSLTGSGTSPPPPPPGTPLARVSPTSMDFGQQTVRSVGVARMVTLSSTGTAPLVVSSVTLAGANAGDFRLGGGSAGTVAAGSQSSIQISFAPTAPGVRTALLSIRHNAGSSPDTVTLTGAGTPGTPQPPPAAGPPVITGYAATNPRGVAIFSAPPGAPLLVLGKNLGTGGVLAFNGVPAPPPLSWSPAEILAIVPAAPSYAFQGPVTASVNGQTAAGPPFTITLPAAPPPPDRDWPVFMHDPRQLGLADTALDPHTLSPWSVPLGSHPASAPVVRAGVAYIGTEAGDVFAIDTATHTVRWQQRLAGPVRAAPAAGETAIVVSAGALYGLNPADGAFLWQRPDIVAAHDVAPMLVNDTVFLGAPGPGAIPRCYAVAAATGADAWPAPAVLPAGFDARTPAAVFPELGLLVMGLARDPAADRPSAAPGAVMTLRLADGAPLWPAPVVLPASLPPTGLSLGWAQARPGTTGAPTLQPAVFIVAGSSVTAWNAVSGAALWARDLPEAALIGPPVVAANGLRETTLLVGGTSGHVYPLSSSTGADAAGAPLTPTAPLIGTLALAGQSLFAPTTDGLVALLTTTGAPIWSSKLAPVTGVAVAGGSPYLATADNLLVGFSVGGVAPPPPAMVHDVAITRLQVPAHVSRQADAQVQVTLANRGTQAEECKLLLRVQPGRVVIAENALNLAAGETKTVLIPWPTPLMGEDGPKTLVAELVLQGQTDSNLANNQAIQLVTVGP